MKRLSVFIVLCISLFSLSMVGGQESPPKVVATTTIIADIARNVGGELVEVQAIIPPDADSHSYQPSPADVVTIVEADVVLVNGAGLEEALLEIVETNATVEPTIVSAGLGVLSSEGHDHDDEHEHEGDEHDHDDEHEHDEHEKAEFVGELGIDADCGDHEEHADDHEEEDEEHDHGACDPHFWMSPHNVIGWTNNIAAALSEADPDNAATYEANAAAYIEQLEVLEAEIHEMVETIPEGNRILVTNHDFLGYFAAEYDFEIVGTVIPSVSSMAEVNPADLAELVEVIEAEGVPAIFGEISANSDLAQTVADEVGAEVAVVTLYSGSLSDEDGPAATYLDYMRHNISLIVNALGGEA